MLNSGPPELPRLIAASVWMKSSYGPWRMSRPRAETMPAVTVPPRPNGLPIASTQSPTRSASESPNCTAGSGLSGFTCSSAMSPVSSRPTTLAFSDGVVLQGHGDLVGAVDDVVVGDHDSPAASMMKPEPRLCMRRVRRRLVAVAAATARAARAIAVEEVLEELLERRAGREHRHLRPGAGPACLRAPAPPGGRDVHHRRQQLGRQVGEAVGRAAGEAPAAIGGDDRRSGTASDHGKSHAGGADGWACGIRRMVGHSLEDWPAIWSGARRLATRTRDLSPCGTGSD